MAAWNRSWSLGSIFVLPFWQKVKCVCWPNSALVPPGSKVRSVNRHHIDIWRTKRGRKNGRHQRCKFLGGLCCDQSRCVHCLKSGVDCWSAVELSVAGGRLMRLESKTWDKESTSVETAPLFSSWSRSVLKAPWHCKITRDPSSGQQMRIHTKARRIPHLPHNSWPADPQQLCYREYPAMPTIPNNTQKTGQVMIPVHGGPQVDCSFLFSSKLFKQKKTLKFCLELTKNCWSDFTENGQLKILTGHNVSSWDQPDCTTSRSSPWCSPNNDCGE